MDRGQSQRKRKRAEEESTEGASTSSFISPEATGGGSGQYDVFLSFRGSDTRKEFTDHLYHSLIKAGTRVFRDDDSIRTGEDIGLKIFGAIAQSKISISVISENYASSKWCLLELIRIMDREKSTSCKVLPIFYKVAPSDVRNLKGKFGDAFRSSLEQLDEKNIQEAREALCKVCDLKGLESEKYTNGYEGELVARVVKTVMSELCADFQLDVPEQRVGLDGHMKNIMNWIDSTPSINARMIGIYGMGGIGKTTLAKCIYNELSNKFEHRSFLPDVRETARRHGIKSLQSQLISDILNEKPEVSSIDLGINIIKSRFRGTKVFILLDDIDDKDQLDKLARKHNWFMAGSMIIVTTRYKAVLDQSEFEVCYEYELNGLDEEHSLLLFNRHAFRTDNSPMDFECISRDIISNMDGLPLALRVVGSYLYKRNRNVWEDVRKQLKSQPHMDVQKILRISYDALEDRHKQIFLDIVCFFIGEESEVRESAMDMWEACGLYPSQGIDELKLRCLIKIGDDDEFIVHDQLRDLGRSIFCQGQPHDERSGPWDCNYMGASRVVLDDKAERHKPWFDDLMRAASSGDSDELLSEIRYLRWVVKGADPPLPATNLHLPKLSVLELLRCEITEDWEGWSLITTAKRLRVLDLTDCNHLRCTPDLSAFTQLEFLTFTYCLKLEHLHPSVGKLTSLVSLDLSGCPSLKELPEEVGELKDLELLDLSFTSITVIPTSVGSLRKLRTLFAYCHYLRSLPELLPPGLTYLWFSCQIPKLPQLPSLIHLEELQLLECHQLEDIPELPSRLLKLCIEKCGKLILLKLDGLKNLEEFSIRNCSSIERLDLSQLIRLKRFRAELCNNLVEIQGHVNLEFLEAVFIYGCDSIERLLYPESRCLKLLAAAWCNNLVEIQGPDDAKFLEAMDFIRCKSMETLPDLNECEMLQSLVVRHCKKLTQLRGFEKLDLIDLDISGCGSLEAKPKLFGTQVFRNYQRDLYEFNVMGMFYLRQGPSGFS